MTKENFRTFALRCSAGLMSLVISGGLILSTTVNVMAAEKEAIVPISGGVTYDLENPPPLPEGVVPPQLGLDEVFLGKDSGISEIELARLLVEAAIGWAAGKGLDFASDTLFSAIFGTNENQQMNEVLAKQNTIIDLLNQMLNVIKSLDYKQTINEKTRKVNTMWERYLNKSAAVADKDLTAQQRKDKLKEYFNGSGENYVLQVIDLYVNFIEGKGMMNGNIFSTYDAYALHNFWWEQEGYDFRTSVRVLDMAQFMQMWTMAYAVCEAHVQDNTQYAGEAKAAQQRLKQCLVPQQGASNDLKGLTALMQKWPVNRQNDRYFTFQVPGREQKLYLPRQGDIAKRQSKIVYDPKYLGRNAYDVLHSLYFTIPDETDERKSHELADYHSTLEPIQMYYENTGDKRSLRTILRRVTSDFSFEENEINSYNNAKFLQRRNFHGKAIDGFNNDYYYNPYLVGVGRDRYNCISLWLNSHDENAKLKKVIFFKSEFIYFSVFKQDTFSSDMLEGDAAITEETTETGMITEVTDNSFTLTKDFGNNSPPVSIEVQLSPNTLMADGSALGMESLQAFLNNEVEVSGTYHYQEFTLDAKTITVKNNSGTQEVSGTVVSSVANAVMVQEDGTGKTNGYFLPNLNEDVPTGSRISIQYHWENGVKTVDSYELQDDPMPGPVPNPVDDPVDDPVGDPVDGPVPGPVSSQTLPTAA